MKFEEMGNRNVESRNIITDKPYFCHECQKMINPGEEVREVTTTSPLGTLRTLFHLPFCPKAPKKEKKEKGEAETKRPTLLKTCGNARIYKRKKRTPWRKYTA